MSDETRTCEELLEERNKWKSDYNNLLKECEAYKQEIYSLKRDNISSKVTQQDLANELDSIYETHADQLKNLTFKQEKINAQHNAELSSVVHNYEIQINSLAEENKHINDQLTKYLTSQSCEQTPSNDLLAIEAKYKDEILELKSRHELELQKASAECNINLHEKIAVIEKYDTLEQNMQCLQENYTSKKEEVERLKEQLLELQEEIATLRMEMNNNVTSKHEEKGNSLFAEVNDRRMKLERIVRQNRATFLEMQRQYIESLSENRVMRTRILGIENKLKEVMENIGVEDERLKRAYDNSIENYRSRILDLESKLMDLEAEQQQPKSEHWAFNMLENSRNEIRKLKKLLDDAGCEKVRCHERIKTLERELNRCNALSVEQALANIQLKLELVELKVCKKHESLEVLSDNPDIKNNLDNNFCTREKDISYFPRRLTPDGEDLPEIRDPPFSLTAPLNFFKNRLPGKVGKDFPYIKSEQIESDDASTDDIQNKENISYVKVQSDITIKEESDTATKEIEASSKKEFPPASILKSKNIFSTENKIPDDVKTKGVTFPSDIVSPKGTEKCLKKKPNEVLVPVTFIKSDPAKMIVIKKKAQ